MGGRQCNEARPSARRPGRLETMQEVEQVNRDALIANWGVFEKRGGGQSHPNGHRLGSQIEGVLFQPVGDRPDRGGFGVYPESFFAPLK